MRTWIGDVTRLRAGDVIVDWSVSGGGTITLQVERLDPHTAERVLDFVTTALRDRRIRADGLYDVLSNARREFDAGSQEPLAVDE